jgi:hypothetical protein
VHEQVLDVEPLAVPLGLLPRVGDGAGEHLVDGLTGRLRCEAQDGERLVGLHPADEVDHAARLHRRDVDEARLGARRRDAFALEGLVRHDATSGRP